MPGFTLIEIMVVVAIVGILFRTALSSYQAYGLKSRRYAAQSCLMELSQSLARYYSTNTSNVLSYSGATMATIESTSNCDNILQSTYVFTLPTATGQTYTLTAAATGTQTKDTGCTALTLQQDGTKAPASCWP